MIVDWLSVSTVDVEQSEKGQFLCCWEAKEGEQVAREAREVRAPDPIRG